MGLTICTDCCAKLDQVSAEGMRDVMEAYTQRSQRQRCAASQRLAHWVIGMSISMDGPEERVNETPVQIQVRVTQNLEKDERREGP